MGAIHPQIQAELDKLSHLVALALSPQSLPPSAFAAQTQTVWWIDAVHGSPNNSGLVQAQAVDSWLTIAKRYTAGIPGLRPTFNPTGGTCTIHVVGTTPTSDPASVLLNAYYADAAQVNVVGVAQASIHTGTLTSASIFARTSAGGQIAITDATVADFHPFVPSLVLDTTSGAIGSLIEPHTGSSATGHVTVGYSAQTVGVFPIQTQENFTTGDSYELVPLATIYLGSLIAIDTFPSATSTAQPQLSLYRLAFSAEVAGDSVLFTSGSMSLLVQECISSQELICTEGIFGTFANVAALGAFASFIAAAGASINLIAGGGGYAGAVSGSGATILLDQDWALYGDSNRPHIALNNGTISIGQSSAWFTGGPGEVLAIEGGCVVFSPSFSTCVFYGHSFGTSFIVMTYNAGQPIFPGELVYPNTAAVATFQFNGTPTIGMVSTPFSPNLATGVYVGPTLATAANLDATPAAAGTALAGIAVDLRFGDRIVGR